MNDNKKTEFDLSKITIPVNEFEKLQLSKDDILVLKSSAIFRTDDREKVEKDFSEKFGHKVILLDGRFSIHGILSK